MSWPDGFGIYSGDLPVGDSGDGSIVAFDPTTHTAIDYLRDAQGNKGNKGNITSIDGLWGLQFGKGTSLGKADAFYFVVGLRDGTGVSRQA